MDVQQFPLRKPGGRGLTEAGARRVLELLGTGASYAVVSDSLNISKGTVHNVAKGRSWAWLRALVENGQ